MKLGRILPWLLFILLISIIGLVGFKIFNPKTYTINFETNTEEVIESVTVRHNKIPPSLPKPTKDSYEFLGWYLGDTLFNEKTLIKENLTLTAKWSKKATPKYLITFDTLGGNEISPLKVNANTIIDNFPIPIKEGYSFEGWYYHNKIFDLNTRINSNLTLIAKWK